MWSRDGYEHTCRMLPHDLHPRYIINDTFCLPQLYQVQAQVPLIQTVRRSSIRVVVCFAELILKLSRSRIAYCGPAVVHRRSVGP